MVNMKKTEPFAYGYIHADRDDKEYRVANGIKTWAQEAELSLDLSNWFQSPLSSWEKQTVRYARADGILLNERAKNSNLEKYSELSDLEAIEYYFDYFRPYETLRMISKVRSPKEEKLEINKCCWAAGGGHSNPDYELILRIGTEGIREKIEKFRVIHNDRDDFYDALLLAVDAVEIIAARYRELADEQLKTAEGEKAVLLKRLSETFSHIPQKQPRNFFEACQMFWLFFTMLDIDSPGLFDYAMGRYYENDDPDDRWACLEKLWELFHVTRTWNLCVGRSDEFGNDCTCKLTYDVLKMAREKKYDTPNLTMRVHPGTPESLWKAATETLATGIGMPAVYNDECVCPALEAIGVPASDSHLYCMNGCNQIDIFGKSHMGLEDGEISVIKALEFALFNGECQFSFEKLGAETGDARQFAEFSELMDAYKKQIEFMADYIARTSNAAQEIFSKEAPNPWKSIMVQGCIEKGLDYKNRGPIYGHAQVLTEGLPDTADSLAAVKHFVFDEKKYTMAELIDALKNDFEGYDELYYDFKHWHKFGNDSPDVDEIYAEITDHIYRYFQTKKTFRGGVFGVGCSTFHRAPNYGYHCGALPNGKKREERMLADSIGATPGCDVNGPTALLNSVLRGNQYLATSGNVMQMKFSKSQFNTPAGQAAFIALAKTYFKEGGQTLQINVVSKEELLDAKEHPENHKNLIVRVGGFSQYFVKLPEPLQDNIIARSENTM
ncbi:MAG: hypothetical protein K6F09_05230 [Clostridiales bacterium]|nr:hypothetical protein [Clostridiales bacterium]